MLPEGTPKMKRRKPEAQGRPASPRFGFWRLLFPAWFEVHGQGCSNRVASICVCWASDVAAEFKRIQRGVFGALAGLGFCIHLRGGQHPRQRRLRRSINFALIFGSFIG